MGAVPGRWELLLGGSRRLVLLIKAHGDGSSTGGITATAVVAAEASRWDEIEAGWQEATTRLGYPAHLSSFLAAEKDDARRREVLGELVGLLNDVVVVCSAAVLNEADVALLPAALSLRIGNQYVATATTSLAMVDRWRREHGYDLTAAVFESGDTGQELLNDALDVLRRLPDSFREEMGIAEIIFAPKGRAGLQMADILAWTMTHWVPEMKLRDPIADLILAPLKPDMPMAREYLRKAFLVSVAHGNVAERLQEAGSRHGFDYWAEMRRLPRPRRRRNKRRS